MRCDEVISELAAPTDDRDAAAMVDHLAHCLDCAEWARRAARLDRLWEATRPPEPSPEAWGSVWANLSQSLDSAMATGPVSLASPHSSRNGTASQVVAHPAPAPLRPAARSRTWRVAAIALVGLAQAAALVVAVGLAWHDHNSHQNTQIVQVKHSTPGPVPSVVRVSLPVKSEWEIEENRLIVIRVEGPTTRVDDVTPSGADLRFVWSPIFMFNAMESIADFLIASR